MAKALVEVSRCVFSSGAIMTASVETGEDGLRLRLAPSDGGFVELSDGEAASLLKIEEIKLRREELEAAERMRAEQRDNYRRDSERVQWRP
jgi:hypothetical protein